jgi:hypothetical protein
MKFSCCRAWREFVCGLPCIFNLAPNFNIITGECAQNESFQSCHSMLVPNKIKFWPLWTSHPLRWCFEAFTTEILGNFYISFGISQIQLGWFEVITAPPVDRLSDVHQPNRISLKIDMWLQWVASNEWLSVTVTLWQSDRESLNESVTTVTVTVTTVLVQVLVLY